MTTTNPQSAIGGQTTFADVDAKIRKLIRKFEDTGEYYAGNGKSLNSLWTLLTPRAPGANLSTGELATIGGLVDSIEASVKKIWAGDPGRPEIDSVYEQKDRDLEKLLREIVRSIGR